MTPLMGGLCHMAGKRKGKVLMCSSPDQEEMLFDYVVTQRDHAVQPGQLGTVWLADPRVQPPLDI